MKQNDLRIGNFVKLKDSGDVVMVSAITKRKVGFHDPNERPDAQLRYRKYSEIEGVLIFDFHDKIDCPTLNWYDNTKTYYYGGFTLHKGVRYIHELQNIHYALTGIELDIEL